MSDRLENWLRRETLFLLLQSFGLEAEVPFKWSHNALLVGGEEGKETFTISFPASAPTDKPNWSFKRLNECSLNICMHMAVWEHTPCTGWLPEIWRREQQRTPDWVGVGGGGATCGPQTSFPHPPPFGIQGVDGYNEAGPSVYHLFGHVVAFLAPCVFFVIGLHSSAVRSTFKPPYSTALLVIAFHDLSQHS